MVMFNRLSLKALNRGLGRVQSLREQVEDAVFGLDLQIAAAKASRMAAIAAIGEELVAIDAIAQSIRDAG